MEWGVGPGAVRQIEQLARRRTIRWAPGEGMLPGPVRSQGEGRMMRDPESVAGAEHTMARLGSAWNTGPRRTGFAVAPGRQWRATPAVRSKSPGVKPVVIGIGVDGAG